SAEELNSLQQLDPRDQARVIETRLTRAELRKSVEGILTRDHYSLAHSLLACLPVTEFVTTNYDQLFELAYHSLGADLRVLPYESDKNASAWLLKLHGSVGRGDLVLTRSDYLELMRSRAALAGIVQAMLITRHMFFVG